MIEVPFHTHRYEVLAHFFTNTLSQKRQATLLYFLPLSTIIFLALFGIYVSKTMSLKHDFQTM